MVYPGEHEAIVSRELFLEVNQKLKLSRTTRRQNSRVETLLEGEPNVLIYERFVSADGSFVHVHERYTDSAAAVAHLRTFGRVFSRRFSSLVDRTRFIVYGTPTAELWEILEGFGATYFSHFGGFSR